MNRDDRIEEALEFVDGTYQKRALREFCNKIIALFLPLDIDFQALSGLKIGKMNNDILYYLTLKSEGESEPNGMLRDEVDYQSIFLKSSQMIKAAQGIDNKDDICNHLNANKELFAMLKKMKEIVAEAEDDKPARIAIQKYLNENDKFWEKVESFHQWYCELSGKLGGDECEQRLSR